MEKHTKPAPKNRPIPDPSNLYASQRIEDQSAYSLSLKKLLNTETTLREIAWFKQVLEFQIGPYLGAEPQYTKIEEIPVPDLTQNDSYYAKVIRTEKLSPEERLVIQLALMPILEPHSLDVFFALNPLTCRNFAEFGGKADPSYSSFTPTLETAMFLLGGTSWAKRSKAAELFSPTTKRPIQNMIELQQVDDGESIYRGRLSLKKSFYSQLIEGKPYYPRFSSEFPAKRLTTKMTWDNLVLNHRTLFQVGEILNWLKHHEVITNDWNIKSRISDGFRALFYGPSGTGKTLTATLLGQKMEKEVYRVDLSQVVSKYIGETEKNMANIFDQAEDKNWILFFDEADALFGKRVVASSSNDQHANQQIAYLLQRIEDYPGVVILATNFRTNMDKAFSRRIQSIIHFPMPNYESRLKLWKSTLPTQLPLEESINLKKIAKNYESTGSMIANIVYYAILASLGGGYNYITEEHFMDGINKEFAKLGK